MEFQPKGLITVNGEGPCGKMEQHLPLASVCCIAAGISFSGCSSFSLFFFFYFSFAIELPCLVDVGTEPDVGKGDPQEAWQLLLPAIMEGNVQVVAIHLFLEWAHTCWRWWQCTLRTACSIVYSQDCLQLHNQSQLADSLWLSEASLQQVLEVLQKQVQTQVDANAIQIPQLLVSLRRLFLLQLFHFQLFLPCGATQRPSGMCECMYKWGYSQGWGYTCVCLYTCEVYCTVRCTMCDRMHTWGIELGLCIRSLNKAKSFMCKQSWQAMQQFQRWWILGTCVAAGGWHIHRYSA